MHKNFNWSGIWKLNSTETHNFRWNHALDLALLMKFIDIHVTVLNLLRFNRDITLNRFNSVEISVGLNNMPINLEQ